MTLIISLGTVFGNSMYAANDASQSAEESLGGTVSAALALAAADDLVGTWVIDQVKIKKTENSSSSERTYSKNQQFESKADCPKKITFTADGKVIFEYDNKDPHEARYKVEGNKITRMTFVAGYEYEYTLTDANKIQLLYSISYAHSLGDNTELINVTEECTFFGTKQ